MAKGVGGGGRLGRGARHFRTFGGGWEADAWGETLHGRYISESLNDQMRDAINIYTGNGYRNINPPLREGENPHNVFESWANQTLAIDRAIANAPRIPAGGLTVRRRISSKLAPTLRIGDVFEDLGFASTTISPTRSFGARSEMWTVQLPRGTKGLYVRSISQHGPESEFLLPRGTEFTVVGPQTLRVTLQP